MTREVGVYDDPHAPTLLTRDGVPFEGETRVEFVSAGAPIHFFVERKAARQSSRIVARWRAIEFEGQELPGYYPVFCECERPAINSECTPWKPKGGRSNLHGDAAVALGRLPRNGDKLIPSRLFRGKVFKAAVRVVKTDRNGKPRPPECWHSCLGRLTRLEAGGSASPSTCPVTSSFSSSDPYASSVTKTSTVPTTKMAESMSPSEKDFRLSQAGCVQADVHSKAGPQGIPLGLGHGNRPGGTSLGSGLGPGHLDGARK